MRRPVDLDAKTVSCDSAGSMDGCTVGWSHENRSCWGHVSGTKPPAVPEPRACISSRLHSPSQIDARNVSHAALNWALAASSRSSSERYTARPYQASACYCDSAQTTHALARQNG